MLFGMITVKKTPNFHVLLIFSISLKIYPFYGCGYIAIDVKTLTLCLIFRTFKTLTSIVPELNLFTLYSI